MSSSYFTFINGVSGLPKQRVEMYKTATKVTIAGGWFNDFDLAGNPGAGVLAAGNTANGLVHTDAIAGYPSIDAFGAGNKGSISRLALKNSVVCVARLFDRVFVSGAHAFNANQALSAQPSFASRLSPANNYTGLELWVEQVTAATNNQAVNVTYTNDADVAGRTTGAIGIAAAPTAGRCWQLPLQAGDKGVKLITNIAGSVGSAGTFNVMLLRPLAEIYIDTANKLVVQGPAELGWPEVFADSALYMLLMSPTGTSLGTLDIGNLDIVNG